jgi:predicted anti-sigma-YlaC factor YlaD
VTCDDALESAAVALLTGEPAPTEVDAHLADCASCREELARLAPLPGLLSSLELADLNLPQNAEPAGPGLLDRLLAAAARDRRRRRAGILAVAAAVIALLIVPAGIWGTQQLRHSTTVVAVPTPAQISWSATDVSTGVSGKAQVWKSAWGSGLSVSVSGVASGTNCTIVVRTKDGTSETAASWKASYTGTAQVRGNVAAPVSTIVGIDIVDDTGKVLLHI